MWVKALRCFEGHTHIHTHWLPSLAAYGVLYYGTSYFVRSSPIERRGLVCRERRSYSTWVGGFAQPIQKGIESSRTNLVGWDSSLVYSSPHERDTGKNLAYCCDFSCQDRDTRRTFSNLTGNSTKGRLSRPFSKQTYVCNMVVSSSLTIDRAFAKSNPNHECLFLMWRSP